MHISHRPFINHDIKLDQITADLDGNVTVTGIVVSNNKAATLTLTLAEALKLFRGFKQCDVEGLAKVFGVK